MSFVPVISYFGGIGLFGFFYWILNSIVYEMSAVSETGDVYNFIYLVWTGSLIIYLIFGGMWVVRQYSEESYMRGYRG